MLQHLTKQELVALVRRLMQAEGTEDELDEIERQVRSSVPHPAVSDLIYYPKVKMTAEEIVEAAMNYQPVRLSGGTSQETDPLKS
jgi:hypothetical protein